uniref:UMOD/GP2/OIT3-like D8C domain-containing protein n=1 Tax=Kryptolebias marmoratus TaxID=37003 RepID=A0A3Q3B8K3_KRYMA
GPGGRCVWSAVGLFWVFPVVRSGGWASGPYYWRSTNNTSTEPLYCDQTFIWKGYYRLFLGFKSAQIPERCIPSYRCGTHAPMWLTEPHPTQPDEIVTRTLCNSWGDSCCYHPSHTIKIKLCHEVHNSENFYIYKFVKPSACNLAFCTGTVPS